ncbi:hypothetical protein J3R30DRAFT_925487 [Lentinula aciculospora]|uniref:Cx9C motif-containing protein 4, mitochondrial n=1 Tax=Lentinula aciculospora TaxID=153920 RepID=A0A9W9AQP5_9AGAR|nr:hypothetical protein J3R30DRAFT_925487 [Lentinula aciculospora]
MSITLLLVIVHHVEGISIHLRSFDYLGFEIQSSNSPSCQSQACDLHDCLGRNTYHPEKCDRILRQLYECCQEMYKANPKSESSACPIPPVVDRWMKDHPK